MKIALISLSPEGAVLAREVMRDVPEAELFLHRRVKTTSACRRFDRILSLTSRLFKSYQGLVYFAPCGVVVRALNGHLCHKTQDPAVVVVDPGGRYAVSLLSGHEGGANALAYRVANILSAEPVISTATESLKPYVVGIGCRKGVSSSSIEGAIQEALSLAHIRLDQVRCLASADIKSREEGILEAARALNLPIRFISSSEILSTRKAFHHSSFVASKVALPAVAEPAALLAGRRTQLALPKTLFGPVTVAIAKEGSLSLA